MSAIAFGVDIGGSGIKGAPVDTATGELAASRLKIPTPSPSTPVAVIDVISQLINTFDLDQAVPIGVTFPAPILGGIVPSVANLDQSWVGVNLAQLLKQHTGRSVYVVNDADAAGYAEVRYGAARGRLGTVAVITLGTGIGTALVTDGKLWPGSELGHVIIDGRDAETWAASSAKEREDLGWKAWAKRLQRYFDELDRLLHPDLFVVGGGVSRKSEHFLPHLKLRVPIIPAALRNAAGIVGAAGLAADSASQAS
ncbi:MAG: ROK family protein [Micrococcales bacterium]|nr:ROK family protein [Micrococcales bacterium]